MTIPPEGDRKHLYQERVAGNSFIPPCARADYPNSKLEDLGLEGSMPGRPGRPNTISLWQLEAKGPKPNRQGQPSLAVEVLQLGPLRVGHALTTGPNNWEVVDGREVQTTGHGP